MINGVMGGGEFEKFNQFGIFMVSAFLCLQSDPAPLVLEISLAKLS